ncbi:hypothetical protein H7992_04455 [Sporosarcina sp. resist]|uniref:hypothetical protein n=1 Tax=Sporosarcina sp. resist TaxID=2762563 RepID=UPI00164ED7FF|nr:hypothetical protein [Sporosarcina sp. resist]QNK88983.1 hypothetical protein H7992_04455 [Sporosarcina sp. resist]
MKVQEVLIDNIKRNVLIGEKIDWYFLELYTLRTLMSKRQICAYSILAILNYTSDMLDE